MNYLEKIQKNHLNKKNKIMTADEANKINLDKETNIEKLKELVKYWQNLAYLAELKVAKLQQSFAVEQIKENTKNINLQNDLK